MKSKRAPRKLSGQPSPEILGVSTIRWEDMLAAHGGHVADLERENHRLALRTAEAERLAGDQAIGDIKARDDVVLDLRARLAARERARLSWPAEFIRFLKRAGNPMPRFQRTIRDSGQFDFSWYRHAYPDIRASGIDPIAHYVDHGFAEGRWPHRLFDTRHYLRSNPDVLESGVNPFAHYIRQGWREGRSPNPHFDIAWYIDQCPDLGRAPAEPLAHFLAHVAAQVPNPSPDFVVADYVKANPQTDFTLHNPLVHALHGEIPPMQAR